MTAFLSPERPGKRLESILHDQRVALREGRLEELSAIASRLEKATVGAAKGLSRAEAEKLRTLAQENARLLRAAMAGLAEVRSLRRGARGLRLSTYDALGRLGPATGHGRTLARR